MRHVLRVATALALLCAGGTAAAVPPLETYARLPLVRHLALSPNGDTLAFVGNTRSGDALFIYPLAGKPEAVASLQDVKARRLWFASDDHLIVNASTKTRVFGWDHSWEHSEAFAYGLKTGKIRQLLRSTEDIYAGQTGLGRIVGISPDGRDAYMPAFMGNHHESLHYSLLRVDLDSGRGRLVKRGTANTIDWLLDNSSQVLAREEYSDEANRYAVDVLENGKWRRRLETRDNLPAGNLLGYHLERGTPILGDFSTAGVYTLHELVGDALQPMSIPHAPGDVESVIQTNDRGILGVRFSGMRPSYAFFEPALEAVYDRLRAETEGISLWIEDFSRDYSRLLLRIFDGRSAGHYIVYDTASGDFVKVLSMRDDLPEAAIGEVISIEYKSRDGLTIPALLTWPPGDGDRRALPTIVLPHGGPAAYDRIEFDWLAQYFASRGYLVFQPNFRGSSGFGEAHYQAGLGQWGRAMNDDISDGLDALARMGAVNPERVCIVGASYGGYAALAGGIFDADRYRCIAAIAPVADLPAMLDQQVQIHGRQSRTVDYWKMQLGSDRSVIREVSPVHNAQAIKAPVLLVHGKDDTVVSMNQSTSMERALSKAGKEVELIKIKGADHWMSRGETRLATLRALDRFVSRHLPVD